MGHRLKEQQPPGLALLPVKREVQEGEQTDVSGGLIRERTHPHSISKASPKAKHSVLREGSSLGPSVGASTKSHGRVVWVIQGSL